MVIRWRRSDIRSVSGGMSSVGESSAGQNFSFPSITGSEFEFEDEDTAMGTRLNHPIMRKIAMEHTLVEKQRPNEQLWSKKVLIFVVN